MKPCLPFHLSVCHHPVIRLRSLLKGKTNPGVGGEDRVTLSTGDVNSTESGARQPPILAVATYPDDGGGTSTVLYLS